MRISKYCIYEIVLFHIFLAIYALTFYRKDEWEVSLFLLFLIFVLLILEYCRIKLFVSPLFFWFAFWLGAITIGRMNLGVKVYPLYREWSVILQKIVLLNTVAFFWFYWIGDFLGFAKKEKHVFSDKSSNETFANLVLGLLSLAITAFCINIVYTGVIPQLTGDANAYRSFFVVTRYYKIVSVLRFVLAFVPIAVRRTASKVKRICLIILTSCFLLAEMLSGWRGFTLQGMILLLTAFFLTTDVEDKKVRKKNFLIAVGAGLLVVLFIILITVTRDGAFEKLEDRIHYAAENFYMYIAPNFLNFQSAVEKVQPKGYPFYALEAIWGLLIPAADNPLYIPLDLEYSIGAYNVCTYLLEPFCDLGLFGTLACSSVVGLCGGYCFRRIRNSVSVFAIVITGMINISVFYFHNNLFLRSSSIIVWIVLSFAIENIVILRTNVNGKKIV